MRWTTPVLSWWAAEREELTVSSLTKVDLFSKSILLVPVHLEVHWCLVTADVASKKICLYDSQGNALQKVARVIWSIVGCFAGKCFLTVFEWFVSPLIEHPEILDNWSKSEAAERLWKWMDGVIWWGLLVSLTMIWSGFLCSLQPVSDLKGTGGRWRSMGWRESSRKPKRDFNQ